MIIDAHVHLPVGDNVSSLMDKKKQLLSEMKENQINKCIVISDSELESVIGSMDECVKLFADTDNVYVVAGISPLIHFDEQMKKLEEYLKQKAVVGIKLFTGHEDFYLTDKRLEIIYEMAVQYDVPVLFHSGWDNSQYSEAPLVAEVAKAHPKLKFVCCHCFYPNIKECQLLTEYSNVYFDISSVADDVTILKEIGKEVKKLIEIAPTRVIFGSDYSGCSPKDHVEFVKKLNLEEETAEKIFAENALGVYKLDS